MSNVNCLEGLACPRCGNADSLLITANVRLFVTDDGADFAQGCDPNWNDDSVATCPECDFDGTLAAFYGRRLPTDPHAVNARRAECASHALGAFMAIARTDTESAVTDLLCNLMHLADRNGTDFNADLARARMHYECETGTAEPDDSTHSNPTERTSL
jgi:hypothetical protein